jgi:transcriptional regulator with XRE-family HTH domain
MTKKYLDQGARVRFLRSLTGLLAKDFCERYGLDNRSYGKWEAGFSPLSLTSANRLVAIAAANGILCHLSWILHGKGEEAKTITENFHIQNEDSENPSNNIKSNLMVVSREIESLRKIHKTIEVLSIADDSMSPQYRVGDYVGGCPIDLTSVKQYLDYPCIIETEDKKKRLRRIGYNDKKFFLFGTNTRYKGGPLFELSPVFLKISPVFWHRMHGVTNENTTSITYSQTG